MFFIGTVIYLALFPLAYLFLFELIPYIRDLPQTSWIPVAYVVSTLLGILWLFLIEVYHPSGKRRVANLIRTRGVKWFAFLTALIISGCIAIGFFHFDMGLDMLFMGLLIPPLVISAINSIGIEVGPGRPKEEVEPGKVILPEIPAPQEVQEEIVKNYTWTFEEKEYSLTLVIRNVVYNDFRNRERVLDHTAWAQEYVVRGVTGEMHELVSQLYKCGMPYGTYQEVSFVLSFVQQAIEYQKERREYPKYPAETLAERAGDCEDFSILGAAILKCMGYEVALILVPRHAMLGVAGAEGLPGSYVVHKKMRYYFCEMTGEGWKIGQLPENYSKSEVRVLPIPPLPVKVVRPEHAAPVPA